LRQDQKSELKNPTSFKKVGFLFPVQTDYRAFRTPVEVDYNAQASINPGDDNLRPDVQEQITLHPPASRVKLKNEIHCKQKYPYEREESFERAGN
jgi:hypothetical protein